MTLQDSDQVKQFTMEVFTCCLGNRKMLQTGFYCQPETLQVSGRTQRHPSLDNM